MPRVLSIVSALMLAIVVTDATAQQAAKPELDFAFFRDKVQPIFLKKRENLARCYICHSQGTPMQLTALAPNTSTWSEADSRANFETIRKFVVPGDTTKSLLLLMPLATEAGGTPFHPGGKHFASQSDPEWQTLAAWVKGAK